MPHKNDIYVNHYILSCKQLLLVLRECCKNIIHADNKNIIIIIIVIFNNVAKIINCCKINVVIKIMISKNLKIEMIDLCALLSYLLVMLFIYYILQQYYLFT